MIRSTTDSESTPDVPRFHCECGDGAEQWTIVEEQYYACWRIVGCLRCHAIGYMVAEECEGVGNDAGEYEASLRAAVQRTERTLKQGALLVSRDWRKRKRGVLRPWIGPREPTIHRKRLGTEINGARAYVAERAE